MGTSPAAESRVRGGAGRMGSVSSRGSALRVGQDGEGRRGCWQGRSLCLCA